MKIAHISTVHPRYDVRILLKECLSLYKGGYDISLVVSDGKGDEVYKGVKIIDLGRHKGRLSRIKYSTFKVLKIINKHKFDLIHIHDPELLLVSWFMKRKGVKVIYDSHEDVQLDILSKYYIPSLVRFPLSKIVGLIEKKISLNLNAVLAATPNIANKFQKWGVKNIEVINNYPILAEFVEVPVNLESKKYDACYIGGLERVRGIKEVVISTKYLANSPRIAIAGKFSEEKFKNEVLNLEEWKNIEYLNWLDRQEIQNLLAQSKSGLVNLYPIESYKTSLPVKMFEYMAAGLPVIASNFPYWTDLLEKFEFGLSVDPLNPGEIARAITFIKDNPDVAYKMGQNGKNAVNTVFNWGKEEEKLINLYKNIIC